MENLDSDSQQRRETFALYGLAMYHAQCFEKSLVILVSVVYNKDYFKSSIEKRDECFNQYFKKTAGQLVVRLKELVSAPDDLELSLIDAVKKRNWLAHDYFWEKSIRLLTNDGRNELISELRSTSEYFEKMDERLTTIYQNVFSKLGLTEEWVLKHLDEMIKESQASKQNEETV